MHWALFFSINHMMTSQKLFKAVAVLMILVLAVVILVYAKAFLVPLTIAALLSMLLLPISKWLMRRGLPQALSILASMLLLVIFFAGIGGLLWWQVADFSKNAQGIEQKISSKYQQSQDFIADKLGISKKKQEEMLKKRESSSSEQLSTVLMKMLGGMGSLLGDIVLVLVYIFLFMYFRMYFKRFVIRLVPTPEEDNALQIINKAQKVSQKYLSGLSLMIAFLWIMYGIGFSIAGVKNAIFFAILCGLLEIIPFVGNLLGTSLTLGMTLLQGGDSTTLVVILITYASIQLIQTYILEPLVVGSEVNINPMFTILGLVAGELLWGIPGMILAIPLMGIAKIVCDHIEPLKPYGELIGLDPKKDESKIKKKIQAWFKKLWSRKQ